MLLTKTIQKRVTRQHRSKQRLEKVLADDNQKQTKKPQNKNRIGSMKKQCMNKKSGNNLRDVFGIKHLAER